MQVLIRGPLCLQRMGQANFPTDKEAVEKSFPINVSPFDCIVIDEMQKQLVHCHHNCKQP